METFIRNLTSLPRERFLTAEIPPVADGTVAKIIDSSLIASGEIKCVQNFQLIPPEKCVHTALHEIKRKEEENPGKSYVAQFEYGIFSKESLEDVLLCFEVKYTKQEVSNEKLWFCSVKKNLPNVSCTPDINSINMLNDLITKNGSSHVCKKTNLAVCELKTLVSERWLSDAIISQMTDIIKSQSTDECFICYLNNYNSNKTAKELSGYKKLPRVVVLAMNVGKVEEEVYFSGISFDKITSQAIEAHTDSSNLLSGQHFSLAVYYVDKNECIYADSLGWSFPKGLEEKLRQVKVEIFGDESDTPIYYCHPPDEHRNNIKSCGFTCNTKFPIQSCSVICGALVSIFMALASFHPDLFYNFCRSRKVTSDMQKIQYLHHISDYNNELRFVLIDWLMKQNIETQMLFHDKESKQNESKELNFTTNQSKTVQQESKQVETESVMDLYELLDNIDRILPDISDSHQKEFEDCQCLQEISKLFPDTFEYKQMNTKKLSANNFFTATDPFYAVIVSNSKSETDLQLFLKGYQEKTRETLRSGKSKRKPGEDELLNHQFIFKQSFRCQHDTRSLKTKAKPDNHLKNTNCPFHLTLKLHNSNYSKKRSQNSFYSSDYPCEIHIHYEHNHSTLNLKAVGFRDVNKSSKDGLLESFKNNCTPALAQRKLHQVLRESSQDSANYELLYADRANRPRKGDIKTLYQSYNTEQFGPKNGIELIKKVEDKAAQYNAKLNGEGGFMKMKYEVPQK